MKALVVACLTLPIVLVGDDESLGEPEKGHIAARVGAAARVAVVKSVVQPQVDQRLSDEQTKVMGELAIGGRMPAMFKLPVRVKGIRDPWGAMADLEQSGLNVVSAAGGEVARTAALLDRLSQAIGKPAGTAQKPDLKKPAGLEGHVRHITAVFDRAKALRDAAIAKLPEADRKLIFSYPATLAMNFGPQLPLTKQTRPLLQNDRAFCGSVWVNYDWSKLIGAGKCLAELQNPQYLAGLKQTMGQVHPIKERVEGVAGDVLLARETPHGLIIFGGKGANTYKLTVPVALIVDLDGDDVYQGTVAASFDADHANHLVIDFDGDDRYEGGQFGLATGRLGVGMLLDLAGSDKYLLAAGSGGTGFGGIGVLCDAAGDDTYIGSKNTQGAAIAGIGLLLDLKGNDRHTSFGHAVGFAGPGAVGAVIDLAGNDSYQCGKKYPSGYNRTDNSSAKPDDPKFQYTAFGLGAGLGRRILSRNAGDHAYALAGGLGMLIDCQGDDRYESSNFSQACGYYFGVGLKLDLAGNDEHKAARYGCASGAHFGMGLFIDHDGKDTYSSTGPTYNGGCSWDHSAFLFVEAGGDDDTYRWENTSGPARADIGSWGIFAEMGGNDTYQVRAGLGRASSTGLAVFFDRAGTDDYQLPGKPKDFTPADRVTHGYGAGGLFVDK